MMNNRMRELVDELWTLWISWMITFMVSIIFGYLNLRSLALISLGGYITVSIYLIADMYKYRKLEEECEEEEEL